jgi:sugar O-acyltransferase (sialic acid O-acetyltransferase NeuD family)
MTNVVIFGINKFAELMAYYVKKTPNLNLICFTVDSEYINNNKLLGLPVFDFSLLNSSIKDNFQILVAIGYRDMNSTREKIFKRIMDSGLSLISYIHPTSTIADNVDIDDGTIILEQTVLQPFVKIGKGNIIWSNVNISHHSELGDFNYLSPGTSLSGNTVIKNNCFLGNNCTSKNNITIQSFTLIGASTYVSEDTHEYDVIVPSRSQKLSNKKSIDLYIE